MEPLTWFSTRKNLSEAHPVNYSIDVNALYLTFVLDFPEGNLRAYIRALLTEFQVLEHLLQHF